MTGRYKARHSSVLSDTLRRATAGTYSGQHMGGLRSAPIEAN